MKKTTLPFVAFNYLFQVDQSDVVWKRPFGVKDGKSLLTSYSLLVAEISCSEPSGAPRVRRCLHEKTRTGASFIPGWLFDFVSCFEYIMTRSFHISLFEGTLHVDKIHVWFKIANKTHAPPVPIYQQTDFTPKRVVVSRFHDSVAR